MKDSVPGTQDNKCNSQSKEASKKYYLKNKDKIKERMRIYYFNNKEKIIKQRIEEKSLAQITNSKSKDEDIKKSNVIIQKNIIVTFS
jgi:hypothetical protein